MYLDNLENEVKAGRTSTHVLTISREMHACSMDILLIRDSQQDHLPNQEGPESEDSQSEDSTSFGLEGKRGWTQKDWEAYLIKLEKEVKHGRAPRGLLIRG